MGEGEIGADVFPVFLDERATESAFVVFTVTTGAVLLVEFVDGPFANIVLRLKRDEGQDYEAEGRNGAHSSWIVSMERGIAIRDTVAMLQGWR